MSSIMRARSGLMGVLLIGVLLVLRPSWWHPHPQARALHIPLTAPIPCSTLRALGSLPQATASAVSFIGTEEPLQRSTLGTEGIPATSDQSSRSVNSGAKGRG